MKTKLLSVISIAFLLLTSCNINKIAVGDASPTEPSVEVGSQRNHFFLWGLLRGGKTDLSAKNFIGDTDRYTVKTKRTFFNGVASFFTLGIYSPTTTSFLIPLSEYANDNTGYYISPVGNVRSTNNNEVIIFSSNDKEPFEEIEIDEVKAPKKNKSTRDNVTKPNTSFDFLDENDSENITVVEEDIFVSKTPTNPNTLQEPVNDSYNIEDTAIASIKDKNETIPVEKKDVSVVENNSIATSKANNSNLKEEYKAVIYFKNGARMNGIITQHPSGDVTIKLPGGSIFESNMRDIERIDPQ